MGTTPPCPDHGHHAWSASLALERTRSVDNLKKLEHTCRINLSAPTKFIVVDPKHFNISQDDGVYSCTAVESIHLVEPVYGTVRQARPQYPCKTKCD